jgi:hypothetical protein
MTKLLTTTAMLLALGSAASAAQMEVSKPNPKKGEKLTIVYIDGDIVEGDWDRFKRVVQGLKGPVAISLNSDGGKIFDGLNIGIAIRNMKWMTIARHCHSVCADIWLAGVERAVFENSTVGFHSAYIEKDGKAVIEVGSGNAVVGAYLSRLGFNYDFIGYATSAKPDDMDMFNSEKAKKYNVSVTVFNKKFSEPTQSSWPATTTAQGAATPTPVYTRQCPQDPACKGS